MESCRLPYIWLQDILSCIAQFLDPNEIACSLRRINKATAKQFAQHVIVRLSQNVPHQAFRYYCANHHTTILPLSLSKRRRLLTLTAASGNLTNAELAVQHAGVDLTVLPIQDNQDPLATAASSGHLHICTWLHQQGCPINYRQLYAAVRAGHQEICAWLGPKLGTGWTSSPFLLYAAARGGHRHIISWLKSIRSSNAPQLATWELGIAAAEGCDLGTFQQIHAEWWNMLPHIEQQQQAVEDQHPNQLRMFQMESILGAAARSPTPDWQAKVSYLEQLQGYPRSIPIVCREVCCGHSDEGATRLPWLMARGYPVDVGAVWVAAEHGNIATLQLLLGAVELEKDDGSAAQAAAGQGHLQALQVLHAHGWLGDPDKVLARAVSSGHLAVAVWLVEELGVSTAELVRADGLGLRRHVMARAATLGDVGLVRWLHEQGCKADEDIFYAAAEGGSAEVIEWLLAHGYRFPGDGEPYKVPLRTGDLATLACLRRLGCPWGPEVKDLTEDMCSTGARVWLDEVGWPYKIVTEEDESEEEEEDEEGGSDQEAEEGQG